MLVAYDRMLNARSLARAEALRDLTDVKADAELAMREFLSGMSGTLLSTGIASSELARILRSEGAPSAEVLAVAGKLDEWKGLAADVQAAADAYQQGTFDAETWRVAAERLGQLGVEVRKQLMELKGTSPRVADYISPRTGLRASVLFAVGDLAISAGEVALLRSLASDLNDQLGDQAQASAQLQKLCERCQNDYLQERRRYEEMRAK